MTGPTLQDRISSQNGTRSTDHDDIVKESDTAIFNSSELNILNKNKEFSERIFFKK